MQKQNLQQKTNSRPAILCATRPCHTDKYRLPYRHPDSLTSTRPHLRLPACLKAPQCTKPAILA